MEIDEIMENADDIGQDSDSINNSIDLLEEKKIKLRKQINQLKSIVKQIKCNLNIHKYKNTKITYDQNASDISANTNTDSDTPEILDVDIELQFQLYRYAGIYCVKSSKEEFIFNFSSSHKYEKKGTFAVQILNKDNLGHLGKWIMPKSIDLNVLISIFPIQELKYIPSFVRTCKHYIDCHFLRQEQYHELMDRVSHLKDCTLQTNLAYTYITLELKSVRKIEDDSYINIVIYLIYDTNEVRPHKVEVDSQTEEELDKSTKKHLKDSLKCFKTFDLCTAFKNILNTGQFIWAKEDDEDSPVEVNNLSNSDEEGFIEEYLKESRMSPLRLTRQQKKRRKRTKTQIKVKSVSEAFECNKESVSAQLEKENSRMMKSPSSVGTQLKKLKQTKLKFRLYSESDGHISCLTSSTKMTPQKKTTNRNLNKLLTSTPMHKNHNFIQSTSIDNISDITVNENGLKNANTNIDSARESEPISVHRPLSISSAKVLQSKIKTNVKPTK
ncbi:uncharacterized protein LOC128889412 [Hylaeus anthracinus]|uniref:uncharacterized protein LOC128889412 n=1 Tax=Hylaeus anthracinus TaxID=313031 RepID=UPI0023BA385A|nr:uncharacterized protein LOC128889412 [Hylaeus anthracinus]